MTDHPPRRPTDTERIVAEARLARSRYQAELAARAWRVLLQWLSPRPGLRPALRKG